jgi:putative ABC transport system ATP-binding protein
MAEQESIVVSTQGVTKVFQVGDRKITVLKNISMQIPRASFTVICGPSGSGKTTLLNILGGIDRPTEGKIFVAGQDLTDKDENFLSDFRCNHVGFVFQAYNLVST